MMYHINVWEKSTGVHLPVGEFVCDIADNGRATSAFRYSQEFLGRADAFALDPVSLPLKAESFSNARPLFGVFEDSLPDDWGRKLLVRKHKIPRHEQTLPNLLLILGNTGMGALSFSDKGRPQPPPPDASILNLSALVDAAENYERGDISEVELALLLSAGSSPGGARPKAVVFDETTNTHFLAKFPSVKDLVDVVKIEAATMSLAAKAGLVVPATRVAQCASKHVLLVERFDVLPTGRRHMLSFQTLLKAFDYYNLRYQDLLAIVRKYSDDPREDSERLFRQMVFNSLVGNTDDHLKNFWMIHDHAKGWRLSPAFDLVPDLGDKEEHVLMFDLSGYYPGRKKLEALGKHWGISNVDAVITQVFDAVRGWKDEFARVGVLDKDARRFRGINTRVES
jgi:serine/threonine-protein kinase HipA